MHNHSNQSGSRAGATIARMLKCRTTLHESPEGALIGCQTTAQDMNYNPIVGFRAGHARTDKRSYFYTKAASCRKMVK